MNIKDANENNPFIAKVDNGYLQVCLCEEVCDHHAKLMDLLDQGYCIQINNRLYKESHFDEKTTD